LIEHSCFRGSTKLTNTLRKHSPSNEVFLKLMKNNELLIACATGDVETAQNCLQDPSCDVNFRSTEGGSAIHLATVLKNPEILAMLLAHPQIDPNARRGYLDETALHMACKAGLVENVDLLLSHPHINPDMKNSIEMTPCTDACVSNSLLLAQMILQNPAFDDDIADKKTFSCLFEYHPAERIIKLLIKDPRFAKYLDKGLVQACKQGNRKAVEILLGDGQIDGSDRKLFQKCMKNLLELDNRWNAKEKQETMAFQLCSYCRIAPKELIKDDDIATAVTKRLSATRTKSARK